MKNKKIFKANITKTGLIEIFKRDKIIMCLSKEDWIYNYYPQKLAQLPNYLINAIDRKVNPIGSYSLKTLLSDCELVSVEI